jgi:hypothetical protein
MFRPLAPLFGSRKSKFGYTFRGAFDGPEILTFCSALLENKYLQKIEI